MRTASGDRQSDAVPDRLCDGLVRFVHGELTHSCRFVEARYSREQHGLECLREHPRHAR